MNTIITFVFLTTSILSSINPSPFSQTTDCQPHTVDGFTLPAWVTNDTWYRPMPVHTIGRAVWYAPNLMESTAAFRNMDLTGFKGGIATNSAGDMGKTAWLKRPDHSWEGPYLIVDVSQRNHAYHHAVNVGTVVEVDFPTAIEWGIVSYTRGGKGYRINKWSIDDVELFIGLELPNAAGGPDKDPVFYKEWYKNNAEFCDGQANRRWTLQDWMITDYDEYAIRLNSEGGETALQERGEDLAKKIYEAVQIKNILSQLPPNPVQEQAVVEEIITVHTLKSYETWTHLALKYYGKMSEPYWRLIYEANIDTVGDDYHHIWGGMELVIPPLPSNLVP